MHAQIARDAAEHVRRDVVQTVFRLEEGNHVPDGIPSRLADI